MAKAKYTRRANGYFEARVWDGSYNQDGTKHRISVYSKKSSGDLEKKVSKIEEKVRNGTSMKTTDLLYMDYAKTWLQTKSVREKATQQMYKGILDSYFRPVMEQIPLKAVSKLHLQLLISRSAEHPRTCQLIYRTFLQILESAIDDRYVPESVLRPVKSVELPKYVKQERRVLTEQEKAAVKSADLTPMQRAFIYLIYGCGLRRGEALAIMPSDIDLKRRTLRVTRAVQFIGNEASTKGPKSKNGYRTIPMPEFLTDFLRGYIKDLDSDYLVHGKAGGLMSKTSFYHFWARIMDKLNEAAGGKKKIRVITGLTPHIFRHTYCTELCYQVPKITTKKIAQILGDDESMVMHVYSHIMEDREDAAGAVAAAISL